MDEWRYRYRPRIRGRRRRLPCSGVELTGKDSYRAFLSGFAPTLTGLTDVAAFGGEGEVALFYYPHTANTKTAATAELFKIKDGKIAETILLFDRMSFLPA